MFNEGDIMHAILIIAHNQFELLKKLILALDDEKNDIFVHIDAKVKDFDFDSFKSLPKYSEIHFTDRINVTWGDFSQVKAEIILLKAAVENESKGKKYSYFHLISGCDLPIKSNDEIHEFFKENNGKEFIHFSSEKVSEQSIGRIRYYHFFRNKRTFVRKLISYAVLKVEKLLGVNRLKKDNFKVQKGCNWFSITGKFAEYIVENIDKWEKVFKYSYCGDEVFVQTIFINSPFSQNLYMKNCNDNQLACARLIDWDRGDPYIFRKEDYDLIKSSPAVFARKFSMDVDSDIVDMVLESNK